MARFQVRARSNEPDRGKRGLTSRLQGASGLNDSIEGFDLISVSMFVREDGTALEGRQTAPSER
jgi:hypothetical protein